MFALFVHNPFLCSRVVCPGVQPGTAAVEAKSRKLELELQSQKNSLRLESSMEQNGHMLINKIAYCTAGNVIELLGIMGK